MERRNSWQKMLLKSKEKYILHHDFAIPCYEKWGVTWLLNKLEDSIWWERLSLWGGRITQKMGLWQECLFSNFDLLMSRLNIIIVPISIWFIVTNPNDRYLSGDKRRSNVLTEHQDLIHKLSLSKVQSYVNCTRSWY